MKKTNLVAGTILALSSSLSFAASYVGISVGQANSDVTINFSEVSSKTTSYSITGGYKFNKYFALEASYLRLGGFEYSPHSLTRDIDGFNAAAAAILPITEQFNIFTKAGAYFWNDDIGLGSGGSLYKDDGIDLNLSLGISYLITQNWEVSTQYQLVAIDNSIEDSDLSNIAIGIQYNF